MAGNFNWIDNNSWGSLAERTGEMLISKPTAFQVGRINNEVRIAVYGDYGDYLSDKPSSVISFEGNPDQAKKIVENTIEHFSTVKEITHSDLEAHINSQIEQKRNQEIEYTIAYGLPLLEKAFDERPMQDALSNWEGYEAGFRNTEKKAEESAFAQAVGKNKGILLDVYKTQMRELAKNFDGLCKREPQIEPKPLIPFFRKFQAGDGNTYNNYGDYLKAQEKCKEGFTQEGRENLKQYRDTSGKYHDLNQARTPEQLIKAGNKFEGKIHDILKQAGGHILEADPQFSDFRKQRETFRELKEQRDQARKTERENALKTERKKERGFQW
jgi:hypothetical protein